MQVLADGHAARDYQDERFSYVILRRGPRRRAPDPFPSIARSLQGQPEQPLTAYQPPAVLDDASRRARLAARQPFIHPEVQALVDAALAAGEDYDDDEGEGDLEQHTGADQDPDRADRLLESARAVAAECSTAAAQHGQAPVQAGQPSGAAAQMLSDQAAAAGQSMVEQQTAADAVHAATSLSEEPPGPDSLSEDDDGDEELQVLIPECTSQQLLRAMHVLSSLDWAEAQLNGAGGWC